MNALKRLKESKTLPPGHIERKKARQSVDKIYNRCLDIAYKWRKRFRKKYPNVTNAKHALAICHTICDAVGERRIKKIVVNSSDVVLGAAHYYKNEIHFANRWIDLCTLIHELTHHFPNCHGHGDEFCEMLDFLFEVAYRLFTNKKPKTHWSS